MKPRVRFAPSPTGFLHVGGLRTALYNFLYAGKHGGDFILRIEDTDRERYVEGAVLNLLKTLHQMGLDADEGLSINDEDEVTQSGKFGPYVQSERLKIYSRYAAELVEKGRAYYCFCGAERLDKLRSEQQTAKVPMKYDELCKKLTPVAVERRLANKEPHVIRLDVPSTGKTGFTDLIRGKIEFENALVRLSIRSLG
ncbi:MAG: glutamyl-tRNA synthetase [Candidatus Magasanikbacteria bacterium]|nr:glutamyl-tRNA synthetase [Candidatus Magasanikbacteria bacterium]